MISEQDLLLHTVNWDWPRATGSILGPCPQITACAPQARNAPLSSSKDCASKQSNWCCMIREHFGACAPPSVSKLSFSDETTRDRHDQALDLKTYLFLSFPRIWGKNILCPSQSHYSSAGPELSSFQNNICSAGVELFATCCSIRPTCK